jgi:glutathione S-transferase
MALHEACIEHKIVEISLRDKPAQMLAISPKATVPVLCLPNAEVIDESLDIMLWALHQVDPNNWLAGLQQPEACYLLAQNDGPFKQALDRYKYGSRFPEHDPVCARNDAMDVLIEPLAQLLDQGRFIGGDAPVIQDIAIFPFVRQFAGVDRAWFDAHVPACVRDWLQRWVESALFEHIMRKS